MVKKIERITYACSVCGSDHPNEVAAELCEKGCTAKKEFMSLKNTPKLPREFSTYVGSFGPVLFDSYCGEPVMWGFPIIKHLGEVLWSEISKYGRLVCNHGYPPEWYLVTKTLDHKSAVRIYGEVTNLELGPRGGFRNITFGDKKFMSKELKPDPLNRTYS